MDDENRRVICQSCDVDMEDLGYLNLRTGGAAGVGGVFLGALNQLGEDLLYVHAYRCPGCRKLAFYDAS